jgi:hypothetical protein
MDDRNSSGRRCPRCDSRLVKKKFHVWSGAHENGRVRTSVNVYCNPEEGVKKCFHFFFFNFFTFFWGGGDEREINRVPM